MRLSVRLMALGVTGPILGLGIFLALSASTVVDLSRKAKLELTSLFDQDNRTNLMLTTSMIQRYTRSLANQLQGDSERVAALLRRDLRADESGQLFWKGAALNPQQAPQQLNPVLAMPLTTPTERAGIFLRDNSGRWRRLTGVDMNGNALPPGWSPPQQTVGDIEAMTQLADGRFEARNSIVLGDGVWRMTRLTPLEIGKPQRLLLSVSVRTDAANQVLESSASLFPYKNHQVAFFGFTPDGNFYCSYAKPSRNTCQLLREVMQRSGGIPKPEGSHQEVLLERAVNAASSRGGKPQPQRLFIATFPTWNWLAVILVEESLLDDNLIPLRQATSQLLLLLLGASLLLLAGCAIAAWQISEGIKKELRMLAEAADGIAAGRTRMQLPYAADDALGRLVRAFNRMAGAVADREESLRARIRTLEIDINQQALRGQVCTITQDPSFNELSARAREMRARRRVREQGGISSASTDGSAG
ncbi:MAG: HAMP domain-containing protein [Synechococcaceae bacterium WB8_1B_136]|nr:HAMP domain-containing protein [Synechococcaceae bacterium WB8_1B_136]